MKRMIILACSLGLAGQAFGQQTALILEDGISRVVITQFIVAVLAGVILAAAFQMLLVNASAAAGFKAAEASLEPEWPKRTARDGGVEQTLDSVHRTVRKVGIGLGVWVLVISSISLFFAAWLAVGLSGTENVGRGAILGLVIWGISYVLLMVLEIGAVSDLLGTVARSARRTLSGGYRAAASVLGASPEKKAADMAEEVSKTVREELLGKENLKDLLGDFLKRQESVFSPKKIRKELENLLDETELEILHKEGGEFEEDRLIAKFSAGGMTPEQARTAASGIRSAVRTIREERKSGKREADQAMDAALRTAGMSPQEAEAERRKLEEYLRGTGREELDPDGIKRNLETLFHDPKAGFEALKGRLSRFDRETVVAILSRRRDMSREEAERTTDQVMSAIQGILGMASEREQTARGQAAAASSAAERKIKDYLDSLGQPELRYEGIKHDLQLLFKDPRAGGEALLDRLKAIDRDTIKALLAHRKDLSEEDAERIVSRVEEARDEAIHKAEQIRDEIRYRTEQVKAEAQHQAAEASRTAAAATLWAFIAAVVSGVAAVLGGMLGAA